jgi:hypothetical protein
LVWLIIERWPDKRWWPSILDLMPIHQLAKKSDSPKIAGVSHKPSSAVREMIDMEWQLVAQSGHSFKRATWQYDRRRVWRSVLIRIEAWSFRRYIKWNANLGGNIWPPRSRGAGESFMRRSD